ncbi:MULTISPECIES: hypothetical protein [unclassified Moorena]|nr:MULTISPECIES: hypothetical protein [unclassified Moorena]
MGNPLALHKTLLLLGLDLGFCLRLARRATLRERMEFLPSTMD